MDREPASHWPSGGTLHKWPPEAHPRSIDPPFRWAILTSASRDWPCAELDMLLWQRWTDATSAAILRVLLRAGRREKFFFFFFPFSPSFEAFLPLEPDTVCAYMLLLHIIPHPPGPCPLLSRNWLWASSRGQGRRLRVSGSRRPEPMQGIKGDLISTPNL